MAALCSSACVVILASPASAEWRPNSFLIGAFGVTAEADTTRLIRLNDADLDYIHNDDRWALSSAQAFAAAIHNLPTSHPGFDMRGIVSYADDHNQDPGRLAHNTDVANASNDIELSLSPQFGHTNNNETLGWYIWDEPCTTYTWNNIKLMSNHIITSPFTQPPDYPGPKLALTNLLPIYAFGLPCFDQYGIDKQQAYRTYLNTYLSQFDSYAWPAQVLSFDHYTFQTEVPRPDYYLNLKLAAEAAAAYSRVGQRIPLWVVIQLGDNIAEGTTLTLEQIRWQAFCALAYGAKGISYWRAVPGDGYTGGLLDANGNTTSRYNAVKTMNQQIHELGPVLMNLDPVTVYHVSAGFQEGIDVDLISNANQIYNMVSGVANPGSSDCMVGHLKHRMTGEDYLMVVNKGLYNTRNFTITLTNPADTVYKFSRSTGQATAIAYNATSFSTGSISRGEGDLFRVVDKVFEYLPNVNAMATRANSGFGRRVYYGHQKGVLMVDYETGYRTTFKDGTALTPVVDLLSTSSGLFVCQRSGAGGNILRLPEILGSGTPVWDGGSSVAPTSATASSTRAYFGIERAGGKGAILSVDQQQLTDSVTIGTTSPVRDVAWTQARSGSVVAANDSGLVWIDDTAPYSLLASWHDGSVYTPVRRVQSNSTHAFAGLDNGTAGNVQRIDSSTLQSVNSWTDGTVYPRVIDLALNSNLDSVLVAAYRSPYEAFTSLASANLAQGSERLTSGVRAVFALAPDTSLLATDIGVARAIRSVLPSFARFVDTQSRQAATSAAIVRFAVASPVAGSGVCHVIMERRTSIALDLYDVRGRKLRSIITGTIEGQRDITWTTRGLAPGLYFLRLSTPLEQRSSKVLVLE
jgi:hypothetical protein